MLRGLGFAPTAKPKAVMLSDANFIYGAEVFRAASGLRADDHHLISLPLFQPVKG